MLKKIINVFVFVSLICQFNFFVANCILKKIDDIKTKTPIQMEKIENEVPFIILSESDLK